MKTKLPLILCILFFAGAINAQTPTGIGPGRSGVGSGPSMWPRYTIEGEEFSIALPTTPFMVTRKAAVAGTNKNRTERVLQASSGSVEYLIYIYENPKPRQSLDDFIREQTANTTRDVSRERILSIDGCTGKEYRYQVKDKHTIEQFFVVEKRLYRFVASGAPADHAGVQHFFSSLAFGKGDGLRVEDGPGEPLAGSDNDEIYIGREVDTKPRLISKPEPSYTNAARDAQIEGTVILRLVFNSTGKVTHIRVVHGLPHGLTERCIEYARKIKFVPATKDERPVSMWMQVEYNFRLY
jgi:TonB family protein